VINFFSTFYKFFGHLFMIVSISNKQWVDWVMFKGVKL
jgi:hypothetical protein